MALNDKCESPCEHLNEFMRSMITLNLTMAHDFEGTYVYCKECDTPLSLEAYGSEFSEDDIIDELPT